MAGHDDERVAKTYVEPPTNYSWAYEFKIQDPDGHVLRFGSEPLKDVPFKDKA